ncbi:hypothetical protein EV361DRAFT_913755 [Lentinula raphanica]|nr:hypothetical protein EV361DRAFT_913755 [Lentinula raphanica]
MLWPEVRQSYLALVEILFTSSMTRARRIWNTSFNSMRRKERRRKLVFTKPSLLKLALFDETACSFDLSKLGN